MPLDQVAVTTFAMTAPAPFERVVGRDIPIDGLLLPEATLARVEEGRAALELSDMSQLADNWDGYGAVPIDPETIKNGVSALAGLLRHVSAPDIAPNPNGTISFEWETSGGSAHLEIGKTRFSFFTKQSDGVSVFSDGDAKSIPDSVGTLVSALLYPRLVSQAAVTRLNYAANDERRSF